VEESCEEYHIEDFFSQLWSVPQPPEKARVLNQEINGGHLVWVRRDLVRSREIKPEDCFLVGRHERIVDKPTILSFSRDIWAQGGSRLTFVEALKQSVMAEGGRWIWQPERPRALGREDGFRPPYQPQALKPPHQSHAFSPQTPVRPPFKG
jgi:hypothetical protein